MSGKGSGCCDSVCGPCIRSLDTDRLDFNIEGGKDWKVLFSEGGGCWGRICRGIYPYWRLVLLAVQAAFVIQSIVSHVTYFDGLLSYWFIKLTHWCGLLLLAYLGFAAVTAFKAKLPPGKESAGTPWFVSVTWALGAANPVMAFMVFVLYWALVYSPGDEIHFESVSMHGGNVLITLLDLLTTRQPYYIQHIYVPMVFSALYLLFSYIYYAAGGTNEYGDKYIYAALDWSNPQGVGNLSAMILFIAVPITYILFWILVALRKKCRKCVEGASEKVSNEAVSNEAATSL
mmetsp:Transcript_82501/g.238319  ORF Transcript_82501/g.238319 Transcript_82501/m.238319 type:complete len:288 (+) Transcript_82501:78-941(+)|eukprot:CAMPEP_0170246354 /NCGR_PEP_ID=MMETSP0116_2-20130129/22964_1 /TAXON_ID=400756 /ORGANISM="Durinskia baltica, Strain CSIRO CS-38" /LENGTH=287 /DNA_ID=CAMNT_0010497231 /DNA_START=71 /DNA_END=934 /DNA_ORIENTATION=-